MFTSLSGTTITLRTSAPSSERWTFSLASASASSSAFRQALGDGQGVAQLALHLHRNGHLVVDQQRRVGGRPRRVGDEAGLPDCGPCFFREMRHHRRGEQQERANCLAAAGARRGLFGGAGQLVNPCHGLVEGERLDVFANRGNGLVDMSIKCSIGALNTRIVLPEQPPQPLDETPAPLDARCRPRQIALGRTVGEHEPAHRVGAVTADDRVRIDGVLLGLRHLDHGADGDRLRDPSEEPRFRRRVRLRRGCKRPRDHPHGANRSRGSPCPG